MTFSWIDLVSSLLGLTCVFLAGRGSKYNFWVGYLYTAALFLLFLQKNLLASLLLQPVSLGINILGHYRWTHPKADEVSAEKQGELKVSMLNWYEEEMGLLGGLDHRQYHPTHPASVGRQHLHADCQCALSCEQYRLPLQLGENV